MGYAERLKIRGLAVAMIASLGLLGCAQAPTEPAPVPSAGVEPSPMEGLPPSGNQPEVAKPAPSAPPPKPDDTPSIARRPAAPQAKELIGLDFDAAEAMLGPPALEEVEAPARVWSYNGEHCVLRLFFYPEVGGEAYRLLSYEVAGSERTEAAVQPCLDSLVALREAAQATVTVTVRGT